MLMLLDGILVLHSLAMDTDRGYWYCMPEGLCSLCALEIQSIAIDREEGPLEGAPQLDEDDYRGLQ